MAEYYVSGVLRKYRSARNIRNRVPQGKLPPKGKPNSYGYNKDGNLLKHANRRPKHRITTKREVWRNAEDSNGEIWRRDRQGNWVKLKWVEGQDHRNDWHMGHRPNREYRTLRDQYLSGQISEKRFLEAFHDPKNYDVEHPRRNESGIDEAIPRRRR